MPLRRGPARRHRSCRRARSSARAARRRTRSARAWSAARAPARRATATGGSTMPERPAGPASASCSATAAAASSTATSSRTSSCARSPTRCSSAWTTRPRWRRPAASPSPPTPRGAAAHVPGRRHRPAVRGGDGERPGDGGGAAAGARRRLRHRGGLRPGRAARRLRQHGGHGARSRVPIVTGDTKGVEPSPPTASSSRPRAGGIVVAHELGSEAVRDGDAVILSGSIGDHAVAILAARGESTSAPTRAATARRSGTRRRRRPSPCARAAGRGIRFCATRPAAASPPCGRARRESGWASRSRREPSR